jgi:RNA polymerase sigma-70 factor (ECF subfamily)
LELVMVATDESELAELISHAQRGAGEARGRLLEMYRSYIGILARLQIDRRLRGRVAPSDLVQDTVIEAERNFAGFRGRSEGELIVWLRSVLSTQVARLYRHHTAQQRDFHLEQQTECRNGPVQPDAAAGLRREATVTQSRRDSP